MKPSSQMNRRRLLKQAAAVAMTGSTMAAFNGRLNILGSALAAQGNYQDLRGYKSLVCVFLYGGSDSFNMYPPVQSGKYRRYAAARGALSIAKNSILRGAGDEVGFHPRLSAMRRRYNRGDLAVVQNVGNLIEPITRDNFLQESRQIPADLFGHNTQQEQWLKGLSSRPTGVTNSGWGGRIADLVRDANTTSLPPTFSIYGSNFWQPGNRTTPIALHKDYGLSLLPYMDSQRVSRNAAREDTLRAILNLPRSHLLKAQAGASMRRAWDTSHLIRDVLDNSPSFNTPYDAGNDLASQLRMAARLIAAREELGMRRQILFVGMGGWDTHDNQEMRLPLLLQDLDQGLESFQQAIEELSLEQSVTTFTCSEFGRTLSTNGDGTDHGWGGHYMVLGGGVQGGRVYGKSPSYKLGSDEDAGDGGRIIPTTSINQYGGVLAQWMGIEDADLAEIFPDLRNHGSQWRDQVQFMG